MMMKPLSFALGVFAILGCSDAPTPPSEGESFLHAQLVRPSLPFEMHRGDAELGGGTMSSTRWASYITSRDDAGTGILNLQRLGASWRDGAGAFDLEPLSFYLGEDSVGNTAVYLRQLGTMNPEASDLYVAESGTVTVTAASQDRVDGNFDIVLVYWCTPVVDREPCLALPEKFSTEAPRLRLVGEFSAVPTGPVPTLPGG